MRYAKNLKKSTSLSLLSLAIGVGSFLAIGSSAPASATASPAAMSPAIQPGPPEAICWGYCDQNGNCPHPSKCSCGGPPDQQCTTS